MDYQFYKTIVIFLDKLYLHKLQKYLGIQTDSSKFSDIKYNHVINFIKTRGYYKFYYFIIVYNYNTIVVYRYIIIKCYR